MTIAPLRIPDPRTEWLWAAIPWGVLLLVVSAGSFATGAYVVTVLCVGGLVLVGIFLIRRRNFVRRNYLVVDGPSLDVCVDGVTEALSLDDVSFIDWQLGQGAPMYSPTSISPSVRVTMKDSTVLQVQLFFAKSWREYRALDALRRAVTPVIVRE